MLSRQPLRILNTETTILGLNISDLIFTLLIYSLSNSIFLYMRLEILSIPLALVTGAILVPIRLNFRRRIVRDFIVYKLIEITRNGVTCVPARFRYYRVR